MQSALNLGGHDITNASFFDTDAAEFSETVTLGSAVAENVIFQNRTTLDNQVAIKNATVSGVLSSDSRTMEIAKNFALADLGKFTSFTTGDLWVSNMTLGGLSISDAYSGPAVLTVNKTVDMTAGNISAMFVTVGFAGSITPRLVVYDRIEDSTNPDFYWNVANGTANMFDMSLEILTDMAGQVIYDENATGTESGQIFNAVVTNKNATVSDYMNAIREIQTTVRAKYRMLNLE